MINMAQSVEMGGDDLKNFAKVAGMSSKDFQKAFKDDAADALVTFIEGLNKLDGQGESTFGMLDKLGLSEIRVRDALLRASGAGDLFRDSLKLGNKAWDENIALTNEAEERYKTTASQFGMLKNTVIDAAMSLGQALLPAVRSVTEILKGLIEQFNGLSEGTKRFIAISAAIVSGLMLIAGPILLLIGFIPQIIAGFGAVKIVFAALTGPIGLIIAGIGLLVAAFIWAYNNVEWFRDGVQAVWAQIKEAFNVALAFISGIVKKVMKEVTSFFGGQLAKIKAFWAENGEQIMTIVKTIMKNIQAVIQAVMGVIKGVFQVVWPIISSITKVAWNLIKLAVSTGINLVLGIIRTVMALLSGDWEGAWSAIKETAEKIWANIEGFFESVDLVQIGKDIINGLIKGIGSMGSAVKTAAVNIASNIKDSITSFLGIKSPSRVMRDQVGVHISGGVAKGITKNAKSVTAATKALAQKTEKQFKDSFNSANYRFKMGEISTSGHIKSLEKVRAAYAKTPAQFQKVNLEIKRIQDAASKVSTAQAAATVKSQQSAVTKVNNTVLSASKTYASKFSAINKKLTSDLKKTNGEYTKALADRQKQIYAQIGLFEKVESKAVSKNDLISNLKSQITAVRQFNGSIAKLSGVAPKAFVDELREMGVGASAEIGAISSMAKPELDQYIKLWKEKHKLAKTEAETQLSGLRDSTAKKMAELRQAATNELSLLRNEYIRKLQTLSADVAKLGSLRNSGKALGKNTVAGIIEGMKSMKGALSNAAKQLASTITATTKKTLKIKSPSRVMVELAKHVPGGAIKGMDSMRYKVEAASQRLADAMTPDVPQVSMAYDTPSGSYDSLSGALNGSVDVNASNDMLAGAIASLERKLTDLRVEMDGREVGHIVAPTVSEAINGQSTQATRGRGQRRIR